MQLPVSYLYVDRHRARLNLMHSFKLEGFELPPDAFAVRLKFSRLMKVLEATKKITKDYQIKFKDSAFCIEGYKGELTFKIRLAYASLPLYYKLQ